MSTITSELMQVCTGCTPARAELAAYAATEVCDIYGFATVNRVGMFLANVGHETGNLRYTVELWGPTSAQEGYDTHPGLGNLYLGDGYKYRGRGWLQTTGRANYAALTERLRKRWPQMEVPDFLACPDMLAKTEWCALSAADYIDMNGIVRFADAGDFDGYCDMINRGRKTIRHGDANGFKDREKLWKAARPALLLAGFGE
jgi:putative chitinase